MADLSFADMHNPKKIDWKKADQYINIAMGVGIFSFAVTLLVAVTMNSGLFLDVILIGAMTFGLYKKNFYAAVIFVLYYLASKIILMFFPGLVGGVPTDFNALAVVLSVLFLYGLVLGAIGTYKYKTEKRK